MRIIPRKLLLLGGAAAIAAGGFAFMASNSVAASSAGEGAGAVSGYTVVPGSITYTLSASSPEALGPGQIASYNGSPYCYGNDQGNPWNCYVEGVQFTLQSDTTTPPGNAQPTDVVVTLLGTGSNAPLGTGPARLVKNDYTFGQGPANNDGGTCVISGWATTTSGAGAGTVTCQFSGTLASFNKLTSLDVEANQ